MKITIEGVDYEMSKDEMQELLTPKACKLCRKVQRQGGMVNLSIGSFMPEYREMLLKQV
jgi:hypothetical protein